MADDAVLRLRMMAGLWPRGDYAPLMEPHRAAPLGADGKPRA